MSTSVVVPQHNGPIASLFVSVCSSCTTAAGVSPKPTRSMLRVLSELDASGVGSEDCPPLVGTCPLELLPTVTPACDPTQGTGTTGISTTTSLPKLYDVFYQLDFADHYLGTQAACALIRTLRTIPASIPIPPGHTPFVRLTTLRLPQCGLDTSATVELYQLLTSGAFAFTLKELDVRNNPYLALEAGQLFLAALGFVILDDSHTTELKSRPFDESNERHMKGIPGLREHVSRLCSLELEGTNVPPHYVRRIEKLCSQNRSL